MPFLGEQLRNERIDTLLINGRAVMNVIQSYLELKLRPVVRIRGFPGTPTIPDTQLCAGRLFDKVDVIAWNINLQGTPGVIDANVGILADRVSRLV